VIHFLIKIIFIIIIFYSKNVYVEEIKIIFSIDEDAYTSIDLKKRIEYIDIVTNNKKFEYDEYLEDYISALIFNHYANKVNVNTNNEILHNYLNEIIERYNTIDQEIYNKLKNLNESQKNTLLKHINYDYRKKLILEKLLSKKNINNNSLNDNILDIYSIEIIYFSFDRKYLENIEDINNLIESKKIKIIENELNSMNINYKYNNKKLTSLNNLDNEIKDSITNNKYKNLFTVINNNNFAVGWVIKNIRTNIELKYTFFQITSSQTINQELIKCENIDKLSKLENIVIKKFEKIDLNKINDAIKTNLNFINDFILINNNNQKSLIILCDLDYNKNLSKQLLFDEKILEEVQDIENEFLLQKKIEYNLKIYE
tara:strand:+ start:881 stop:1993 length:1113 start_codon:yes stop_codon:yes gene_type:complete